MVLNRCVNLHFSCPGALAQGSREGEGLVCIAQLPTGLLPTNLKESESGTKARFWKGLWGFSRKNSIQLESSIPSPAAQGSD